MSGNWEHFRCAALVLAGPGSVKQRLSDAYLRHLAGVDARELPDTVGSRFSCLVDALSRARPAGGLCAVEASVRKMSESEAGGHATSIMDMFVLLSGRQPPTTDAAHPRLRVVADDDLPEFLVSRA